MPTIPTQVRLTSADLDKLEAIRARYGLPSLAAAIRHAVEAVHRRIEDEAAPVAGRRIPRRGGGETGGNPGSGH